MLWPKSNASSSSSSTSVPTVPVAICTGSLCGADGTAADTIRNEKELAVMQQSVTVAYPTAAQRTRNARQACDAILAASRSRRNHKGIRGTNTNAVGRAEL